MIFILFFSLPRYFFFHPHKMTACHFSAKALWSAILPNCKWALVNGLFLHKLYKLKRGFFCSSITFFGWSSLNERGLTWWWLLCLFWPGWGLAWGCYSRGYSRMGTGPSSVSLSSHNLSLPLCGGHALCRPQLRQLFSSHAVPLWVPLNLKDLVVKRCQPRKTTASDMCHAHNACLLLWIVYRAPSAKVDYNFADRSKWQWTGTCLRGHLGGTIVLLPCHSVKWPCTS